jgi:hypothetical protein
MNAKQLNYYQSLSQDKKNTYLTQRLKLELEFYESLLKDPLSSPTKINRLDVLTCPKEIENEVVLDQLEKLYTLDTKLYFKSQEIEKQRKELKGIILDLEKTLTSTFTNTYAFTRKEVKNDNTSDG